MKKAIIIFFTIFVYSFVFAQTHPTKPKDLNSDTQFLREAKVAFRSGEYGKAIKLANEAKVARKEIVRWQKYTLENSFRASDVKKENGNLKNILTVLNKKGLSDPVSVINTYLNKNSIEYFNNSSTTLISYISDREKFPEADVFIGEVYKIEGEYNLASKYLLSAWENKELLDIPDEQYDILYSLSDIDYIKKDYDNYEKRLLLIIGDENIFKNKNLEKVILLNIKNNKKGTLDKFFTLFRSEDYTAISAFSKLAFYYESMGKEDKAVSSSALSVVTSFTKMYNVIKSRDSEYEYTTLADFFMQLEKYSDIIEWTNKNEIWKCFIDFAFRIRKIGNEQLSQDLYGTLANYTPDEYWKQRAIVSMQNAQ